MQKTGYAYRPPGYQPANQVAKQDARSLCCAAMKTDGTVGKKDKLEKKPMVCRYLGHRKVMFRSAVEGVVTSFSGWL
jgi:hypothetical protein